MVLKDKRLERLKIEAAIRFGHLAGKYGATAEQTLALYWILQAFSDFTSTLTKVLDDPPKPNGSRKRD